MGSKLKDFAIHVSEIDLASGRSLTAPKVIRASPHGIAEGSHIIKRGKYYYLFTAEGGTEAGHQEWVLRSEVGPLGPWELGPVNPLWYNGTEEEVQSTGHADVFEDAKGDWWGVFLGVRPRLCEKQWLDSPLGTWMSHRVFRIFAKITDCRKRDVPGKGHLGERLAYFQRWKEYHDCHRREAYRTACSRESMERRSQQADFRTGLVSKACV